MALYERSSSSNCIIDNPIPPSRSLQTRKRSEMALHPGVESTSPQVRCFVESELLSLLPRSSTPSAPCASRTPRALPLNEGAKVFAATGTRRIPRVEKRERRGKESMASFSCPLCYCRQHEEPTLWTSFLLTQDIHRELKRVHAQFRSASAVGSVQWSGARLERS